MTQEEIDKVIADAVAESQGKTQKPRGKRGTTSQTQTLRKVLNTIFMVGFVATILIYFAGPTDRTLFFCVGFGTVLLKVVEFVLRFMRP